MEHTSEQVVHMVLDLTLVTNVRVQSSSIRPDVAHTFSSIESFSQQMEMSRILIATPVKNAEQELPSYFSSILQLSYPRDRLSVFLLESDSSDGTDRVIREFMDSEKSLAVRYERVPVGFEMPLEARHDEQVQLARRKILADARNTLLNMADLGAVDYVLWLDVDATAFPASLIEDLLSVGKPVVAPHVVWDFHSVTYDRNSWLETFPPVFDIDAKVMFEGYEETEGARIYMDDFRRIAKGKLAQVPLHGVGTAVLLVDAKLYRDLKLRFPVLPYKRRVESEGFGLLAMDAGFQAVGLPNYEIKHFNHADKPGSTDESGVLAASAATAPVSVFGSRTECLTLCWFAAVLVMLYLVFRYTRKHKRNFFKLPK